MADSTESNKRPGEKSSHALREERILAFWKEKGIFEKSLNSPPDGGAPKEEFVFYDGPPFANGLPHYGHILPGTIKDVIPRWKTMQGYRVRRRWGWDCHGLPVENLVEKELGLKTKKDILAYGIDKFNEAARKSVMRYADEWRRIVPRLGRWVDMEDDYRTMDATYTESVWWIFKKLYDKGLIYEGFKSMNICPRCETTLSNFEVAQGYRDIVDISIYVKFRMGNTYLLAWTTTPWTLPGNVALAVNPRIEYVKVEIIEGPDEKKGKYIIAKDRLSVLKDLKYVIVDTIQGAKLVGLSYEPVFDHYSKNPDLKNRGNGWKIYGADFVTTGDGTGIVHIAPAFGSDDYELSVKHDLPFVQHVNIDGTFQKETGEFSGLHAKPKDTEDDKNAHQKTDIEIIKWLAYHGSLFEKEKITHSYPHCWRCDTPLLNYATSSWFVKVTDIKNKLVKENKKVVWVPVEVGEGRFGNWLAGARDWAISRSRFWGAPIPVWKEVKTGKCHVIGSIEDLKRFSRAKNTYYVMRHGEAENNVARILDSWERDKDHPSPLTTRGKEEVLEAAKSLKDVRFDLVFVSPLLRTKQTALILKDKLGWKDDQIITDERIREMGMGEWNGKDIGEFYRKCRFEERFTESAPGGENYADIKKRMGGFLYDLESKYEGKNILVITHETPIFLLIAAACGLDREQSLSIRGSKDKIRAKDFIDNAEVRKVDFTPLPHNSEYELDLHRPFIDQVELMTSDGNKLARVPEVFDCWFESGAMPYGEAHYPFEDSDGFDPRRKLFGRSKGFPADFIAEGLDQTRGWFYSMIVLGVALFGVSPYKKVIVNGLVLAEDGEKMSKRKNNYPDPMELVQKYGADALRYYLISSPVVRGQDLSFSERGVDEVVKKIINRLLNVVSFYELYDDGSRSDPSDDLQESRSPNILDRWIISRLNQTIRSVTDGLEKGELDRSARPVDDFIDDLSVWYLRRSRDRFKDEDKHVKQTALDTTRSALMKIALILAPFMPFVSEEVYSRVRGKKESVHLESWPEASKVDTQLLEDMQTVRDIASKGLEARMAAKINVRQPLQALKIKHQTSSPADGLRMRIKNNTHLLDLIKDEVNVKNVLFDANINDEVELDTAITPELKEEGDVRELLRKIQDLRKEGGLTVKDKAVLIVPNDLKGLLEKHEKEIMESTNLSGIEFGDTLTLKL